MKKIYSLFIAILAGLPVFVQAQCNVTLSTVPSPPLCAGTNIEFTANVTGETPLSYQWYSGSIIDGETSSDYKSSAAGAYYVIVTTASSTCTSATSTINPQPAATVIADKPICIGSSVNIGAAAIGGHTYKWTSVPSNYTSNNSNPSVSPPVTNTYTLTETITATGCTKSNSVVITVNAIPVANTGGNKGLCTGASVTIGAAAVAGNTYSWTSTPAGFISVKSDTTVTPTITTTYTLVEKITASGCTKTNTAVVTVYPIPAAVTIEDKTICAGIPTSIGGSSVGGHIYKWTSNPAGFTSASANPSVSPTITTTYTLLDSMSYPGCRNTNSVILTVNPSPAAYTGGNKAICIGASVTLGTTAVAGNTYSWTSSPAGFISSDATSIITPTITTTYTLTETNPATLCFKTNTAVITVNPLPLATTGTDRTICSATPTVIGAASVNGHIYKWTSNPAGYTSTTANPTVTPTITTTYTLLDSVATTGCKKTNSVTLTVNPVPAAFTGTSKAICLGFSTLLGAPPVAGNTYQWSSSPAGMNAATSDTLVSPTVTTTYTLKETIVSSGCNKTNTITITVNGLPTATTGLNRTICEGSTTQIGGNAVSGHTYIWTTIPIGYTSNISNPSVKPLVTTTYTLTDSINTTGCKKTNSVVITVNPAPLAITGDNKAVCPGTTVNLGAEGVIGNTYKWTSSPAGFNSTLSNPTVTPAATTTYTLAETNTQTGCQKTNTVIITINPLPAAATGASKAICIGSSTTIGAAAIIGNTYSWASNPSGFSSTKSDTTVSPVITTTYTLTERITATGCQKSNSVTITVNPLPIAATGSERTTCAGTPTTLGAASISGHTYNWTTDPPGTALTTANPSVSPTITTTYTLTETITATKCYKTNSVIISVNPLPSAITGTNTAICLGASIHIGSSAVVGNTYSWSSKPAGFIYKKADTTVTPTVTTTYTLIETITTTGCLKTNSIAVTVNPLPAANVGTIKAVCIGSSIIIGTTTLAGHTYRWSSIPGDSIYTTSNPSVSPTIATTYTLTEIITATGCQKTNTLAVSINPLPVANAGDPKTVCSGIATTIGSTAITGSTYKWTANPAGYTNTTSNPSVTTTITTTYTLTETITATKCAKSNSVIVSINPVPAAITGGNKTTCAGTTISIGSTAVVGNTYLWSSKPVGFSSKAADTTITPTVTTTYTLVETITATGCLKTNTAVITVNPLPAATAGTNKAICMEATTTIGATSVNGHKYSWTSNPSGFTANVANPTISPTVTTTYTLTDTITSTKCYKSNSVIITVNPLPDANTGGNKSICTGSITSIGSNPVGVNTYKWTSNPPGLISTSSNPNVNPSVNTTYTLTETITGTGCKKTNSIIIKVKPLPNALITPEGSTTFCNGESVKLNANTGEGLTYQWQNNSSDITGATNSTINATNGGSYTVVVTDTSACYKTSSPIQVNEEFFPSVQVTPAGPLNHCSNTPLTLNANASGATLIYQWQKNNVDIDNANNATYAVNEGGNYRVKGTNSCGTATSNIVEITDKESPVVNLGNRVTTLCVYRNTTLDAGSGFSSYNWSNGSTDQTIYIDGSNYGLGRFTFSVTVTNASGCSATDAVDVIFDECISINEADVNSSIKIFPNPNDGLFYLSIDQPSVKTIKIQLLNLKGQELISDYIYNINGKHLKKFDISDYAKGFYILKIESNSAIEYRKILLQ